MQRRGSIGKPCGYGQYVWKNGSSYWGEFRDGLKHGFGKWRKNREGPGNAYEGQYYKDKKQGFGIFKWASGNLYRGQYKNDERDGFGEMRWTDGSVYIGQWCRGIQHGYGHMYFADGTTKEGIFDNNIYKGPSAEVPTELADPNLDIMTFAPKELVFSEEMKAPGRKPFPRTADEQGNPLVSDVESANYSVAGTRDSRGRALSKDGKGRLRPLRPGKEGNRSFSISSKAMIENSPYAAAAQLEPVPQRGWAKRRGRIRRNRKRKIWIPTGKAHYFDTAKGRNAVY